MKSNHFKVVLSIFLIAVLGLLCALYYYNKPHLDIKNTEAVYVLNAQNLIEEFQLNETDTNAKYAENVIQVTGTISEISTLKGTSVITLRDENSDSSIICHMLLEDNKVALQHKKGEQIMVKGICAGYLIDVIMVRCTLAY